jgi:pimeloyl-ACP methyl ester carboxylesterase
MSTGTAGMSADPAVRPFHVDIAEEAVADLRRRIAAWRPPEREPVDDQSQGVQLATVRDLANYWATEYDWRRCEAKLNAIPQFTTEIDGLDVHFIHARSSRQNALPLIVSHGWPGSIIEQLKIIEPLTNPTEHGGSAPDAFDVVIPSLPGYGYSGKPAATGWGPDRIARAWAALMQRLGYTRYVAQGGDVGAAVTDTMAIQAPDGLAGIHLNFLRRPPPDVTAALFGGAPVPEGLTEEERAAFAAFGAQFRKGYIAEQGQSPQTIGYSLTDSPAGLAAWMLDHDTDSYEKISRVFAGGQPSGGLARDHILDNITLYWLTGTATSAARMYWESARGAAAAADHPVPEVSVPVAFTVFPGEIFQAPRSWAEQVYPNLIYFHEAGKGGHFAAWEEPDLFVAELQEAFRSLRWPPPPARTS